MAEIEGIFGRHFQSPYARGQIYIESTAVHNNRLRKLRKTFSDFFALRVFLIKTKAKMLKISAGLP